jgi:hypothetical protein
MKRVLAIDPDLYESGLAILEDNKLVFCSHVDIEDLLFHLHTNCIPFKNDSYIVLLEAGHMNKNTWHPGGRGVSKNVGKGMAVGIIIENFLKKHKITHRLVKPAGYSNFFKDEKFFKRQTGWCGRTNNDARSAAAIAFLNK